MEYIQDMKIQSFTSTFMFNMKKSFKSVIMEDTKKCVSHNDSWRRINNDFATMKHALEKSKQKTWRRGTECDRKG
jgi:hypothetical protein